MSTYLALSQKLRRECINGYASGPSTVTGQTGLMESVVNWIADSYKDIQRRHPNWRWMRSQFTVNTVASTDTYAYTACTDSNTVATISRFSRWWANDKLSPFKCYLTSGGVSGQYWLIYIPYNVFRHQYKFGAQQSLTGQPIHVSVDDSNRIVLGPNPNAIYTVSGDYQRGPQTLAADADEPDMDAQFHDLIVYQAMRRYATRSVAPEKLAEARLLGDPLMRQLENAQLPEIRLGRPLV